jgi:hypothetical protein
MPTIVIGGHSRSVGKTSVVAELISALPEFEWTAVKITQYGHGICSVNGRTCDCATADHAWAITEERDRSGGSDTSRFLVAGARRALWVRTEQGRLAEAMPALRAKISPEQHLIMESNSVLKFMRPDLYLTILNPQVADFKASARQYLDLADAVIVHQTGEKSAWKSVSLKPVLGKPIFSIQAPPYVTPQIVSFVRSRLSPSA